MEQIVSEGRLMTADQVREFLMAGNATLTLRSGRTHARYTYRVRTAEDGGAHFVALLNGADNESAFSYLGFIGRDGIYRRGRKSRIGDDAPGARAFDWFHGHLENHRLPDQLEVWHEGKCGRCGRKLTVPESVERGLGPECAEIVGG